MLASEEPPEDPVVTSVPTDLPPPPSPPPEVIEVRDVHSKSADFIEPPTSPNQEFFGMNNLDDFLKAIEEAFLISLFFIVLVPECPSTVQPMVAHRYYDRPRIGFYGKAKSNTAGGGHFCRGVLRNWPNSSNLNMSPPPKEQIPRQRSVTFEPKPGSAPGDTEVEDDETCVESEVEPAGNVASSALDGAYNDVDGGELVRI